MCRHHPASPRKKDVTMTNYKPAPAWLIIPGKKHLPVATQIGRSEGCRTFKNVYRG